MKLRLCDGVTACDKKSLQTLRKAAQPCQVLRIRCHTLSHDSSLSHDRSFSLTSAALNLIPSHTLTCLLSRLPSGLTRSWLLPSLLSRSSKTAFESGCFSPAASAQALYVGYRLATGTQCLFFFHTSASLPEARMHLSSRKSLSPSDSCRYDSVAACTSAGGSPSPSR